jgi:hypothetical protein
VVRIGKEFCEQALGIILAEQAGMTAGLRKTFG